MKKLVSLFIFIFLVSFAKAQILDPVKYSTSVEKISDSDFNLVIKASIEEGWHLYSQNVPEDLEGIQENTRSDEGGAADD